MIHPLEGFFTWWISLADQWYTSIGGLWGLFNNMNHPGRSMILSLTTIRKHRVNGTGENLLRRHQCAIHVAEMFHFMWYSTSNMTPTSVPAPLHKLVKHYNKEYLKKPNDLPIVTKRLWCIIFCKRYSLVELRQMSQMYH